MAMRVRLRPTGAMNQRGVQNRQGAPGGRAKGAAVTSPMVNRVVIVKQSFTDRARFLDDVGGDGSCDVRLAAVNMLWNDIAACEVPAVGLGLRRLLFQVLGIAGMGVGAAAKLAEVPEGWDHETIARVITTPPAEDSHPLDAKCLPPPEPATLDDALPEPSESPSAVESVEAGVRRATRRAVRDPSNAAKFVLGELSMPPRSPRTEADVVVEAKAELQEQADDAAEQAALLDSTADNRRRRLAALRGWMKRRGSDRTTDLLLARTREAPTREDPAK